MTLILAMDVSRSMQAGDVSPNRISAAQGAAKSFIQELPRNVRVGIVSFAGTASLVHVLVIIVQFPFEKDTDSHRVAIFRPLMYSASSPLSCCSPALALFAAADLFAG